MEDFSFREEGTDSHGNSVRLGEPDGDGVIVGYIDLDGTTWESLRERDIATTVGRFWDSWLEWNRSGGLLGEQPDPEAVAQRECLDPENQSEAALSAAEQIDPDDPFTREMFRIMATRKAQAARWN